MAMQQIRSTFLRWWHDPSIRFPVQIFVAARLLTLIIGVVAVHLSPVYNPYAQDTIYLESLKAPDTPGVISELVQPWYRWDTGWYLKIAATGYASWDGSIIFGPLYPFTMRIVGNLFGDTLFGGLLVSSVACLIFLILLFKLVCYETGDEVAARMTLWGLIAFPTAFYLMAGYTESLFLVCTVGAIWAARTNRWWLVVPLALCASLTRVQGWILFWPLGWLAFVQPPRFWQDPGMNWRSRLWRAIPRLAAMGAGPLGSLGYMLYTAISGLGNVSDAYTMSPWNLLIRPPWQVVIDVIGKVMAGHAALTEIAGLTALLFLVILAVASLKVLPIFYHLYIWPTLFFILMRYYPLYLLNGTMRYVLDFFPLFMTFGFILSRQRFGRVLWVVAGSILQLIMCFLFVRWLWVA